MKIDRTNYEIWLTDWLDGKLNNLQVEQLELFLNENPDLKEGFDEMSSFRLKPSAELFPHKNKLKKSIEDLPLTQFENLCVAYLENDLSADQQTELKESIGHDQEKKRIFELIQKMRLVPAEVSYRFKNKLIKRSPAHNIMRLSLIGLSAAATVLLIIMVYLSAPRSLPDEIRNTTLDISADSSFLQKTNDTIPEKSITKEKTSAIKQKNESLLAGVQQINSAMFQPDSNLLKPGDQLLKKPFIPETAINKVPVNLHIDLKEEIVSNTLIVSDFSFTAPPYDNDGNKISRLIAKTFREKILKENSSQDNPLKGYEIAEAGIKGINKLLGWNMTLAKNNDVNGELKSVYFTSAILKFNAPVKKTELWE